jgi:DoxX-like family
MSIYVEILVRAPMDALWAHTQTPRLHEQWDLRFSNIDYIPRVDDVSPQRFRYATRLGFGLEVMGEGETTGRRELPDGSSTSVLKFASDAPLSIIREGSGYWKYVPTRDGVRFLTCYDYRTRFGAFGVLFDRVVFRPVIGWATAWSFDRLRLWVEGRVHPRIALRQTLIHVAARMTLAIVLAYQGLVPKLLARHVDEVAMMGAAGVPARMTAAGVAALGCAELALAAVLLARWLRTWPVWLCLIAMPIATIGVAITSPAVFGAAFNPFSLNVSVAAIAGIDLFVIGSVPSAGRCRRRPAGENR